MGVPGYQEFMLPLLKIAADGQEHRVADAMEILAAQMGMSREDQTAALPSGVQTRFYNRVTWAITYLSKSLLLERTGRGRFKITAKGTEILQRNPARIDNRFLDQFPEFKEFKKKRAAEAVATRKDSIADLTSEDPAITPEERLEAAYAELRDELADDILRRVRAGTPKFFEHLVLRLLTAMGYGADQVDRAKVTGQSGDEGIDGVIPQDRLDLDMVYIQAKKWDNSVGPGEIDKFVGSLMRKRASKGVFITSGTFTDGARRAGKEAAVKVRLIDGDELADLMIDYDVGVAVAKPYIVKKVDGDFFEELA
jgi:restriction system protein